MKTVTILKSDIEDSNYDAVLTAIDIEASDLDPGTEVMVQVIIKNDIEDNEEDEADNDQDEEQTEDQKHG